MIGILKKFRILIFYFITIIVITIFLLEILYYFLFPKSSIYFFDNRYMLFSSDKNNSVFNNKRNFFLYFPNQKNKSKGYFLIKNKWLKEYDYSFKTNNLGLVQNKNIYEKHPSILFLGDSFLEGQGAEPWFNEFEKIYQYKNYQLINGGFLGTGFQQWYNLYIYLKEEKKIKINKIVVFFISDDLDRGIFQLNTNTLNCIKNYNTCTGYEGFYGMPNDNNLENFLNKLSNVRSGNRLVNRDFREQIKRFLPGIKFVYSISRSRIEQKKNEEVIKKLIDEFQTNIVFVHMPTKSDLYFNTFEANSKKINKIIIDSKGNYIDGFKKCSLTKEDYSDYDGHPNKNGYRKMYFCLNDILRQTLH
jgi:hypothetical protein